VDSIERLRKLKKVFPEKEAEALAALFEHTPQDMKSMDAFQLLRDAGFDEGKALSIVSVWERQWD
jgi:hypothetical protein